MTEVLYRLGRTTARHPWVTIGSWLAVSLLVLGSAALFGRELEDTFDAPGLDSQRASELLASADSSERGLSAHVVLAGDATLNVPERAAVEQAHRGALGLQHVLDATVTYSPDGRIALLRLQYPSVEDLDPSDLGRLKDFVADARSSSDLDVEAGGPLFFAFESPPAGLGEIIGLVVAAAILLVAFGSLLAAGLPIGMALFGLVIGVSSMSLLTYLVEIPAWAPEFAAMVGLGVGLDYALLLLTRHREHLAEGVPVEESVGLALATAGKAVIGAGGTVVLAILGLAVAGIPFVAAGGVAISAVVLVMVAAAITLLPALFGLAGLRLAARTRRRTSRVWYTWGNHVTNHAKGYAVAATLVMVALAAPALALTLGFPDEGTMPEARTERRAYDLVSEGFGPGANGPIVIAVDVSNDPSVVQPLTDAVAADPGIANVVAADVDLGAGVATLVAEPTTPPQDDATKETIHRLRAEVFPAALGDAEASAHVGGQTATFVDLGDRVRERLPLFVVTVVLLSFALLVLMFRSVLVPLKAAVLNLLSVGAAYGVLVMVFQWGWGAGLIGVETTVPVISFIPLFMFAILFGLSMDYEVFLLSRIREEYLRTGDNKAAVVRGVAATGRTITAAALIMVAVFSGFILGSDPVVKMMGLGCATAILLDATIIRLVLVPATMTL
ncbi:MAG TPA: MMPL family transporter, partial [Nocardioidaceae bacterium]|nr:MMPL family transporter [Nocardioidaceae bacterium]